MRITCLHVLLVGISCCAGGCGPDSQQRVPLAGRVLIDGQPLTSGTIRFVPESGRPASSAIMADGSFDLASESINRVSELGVPRGKYRVQVSALNIVDDETIRWNAPEKYADFRTSGLDVTIDRPTDDLLIELTWGDAKPADDNEPRQNENEPAKSRATQSTPEVDTSTPSRPEDAS